ncbi:MAG: hypothetical protein A2782_03440 [Candidatus Blackburnbacteria bacterium RIFCSPHIGHO2_01_FULL_43_15b]|uniref:Glycosyltransferase 2-like domain-containing protein n=1 Tax=Candidatus Blackburnbacteria bacterium RIFCSPHIGHO2_01_FULL_43_15b TaxID=1797513 RepID=A0A1G1V2G9_9BACT|nr:MAG: hypothetical protein A2782_03440 [Candidatus Blackburnbacteria bacterium RIFCSPHIGHO2_01_FULL_43_15b]
MEKVDLSIVILVYNAKGYLEQCIDSIRGANLKDISWEIVLVDNASTDGSRELVNALGKKDKHITAVLNLSNLGFSKGNNEGIKIVSGRYILFLNPDTVLSKDALKEAFLHMEEHPDVGAVGARLHLPTGETDSPAHRGFPTPLNAIFQFIGLRSLFPHSKIFSGYTLGWLIDSALPHEVDVISGAFFLIRRNVGESLGWWDEDYFMYGEDIDFSYRIKQAGWKIIFLPKADVLHYGGVSAGIRKHIRKVSLASPETRLRSIKASTEAMRLFYTKHYTNKYPSFLTDMVLFGISLLEYFRILKIKFSYNSFQNSFIKYGKNWH